MGLFYSSEDLYDDDCDIDGFPLENSFDCKKCVALKRNRPGQKCDYLGTVCHHAKDDSQARVEKEKAAIRRAFAQFFAEPQRGAP